MILFIISMVILLVVYSMELLGRKWGWNMIWKNLIKFPVQVVLKGFWGDMMPENVD